MGGHLLQDVASRPWSNVVCRSVVDDGRYRVVGEGVVRRTQAPHSWELTWPPSFEVASPLAVDGSGAGQWGDWVEAVGC